MQLYLTVKNEAFDACDFLIQIVGLALRRVGAVDHVPAVRQKKHVPTSADTHD